MYLDMPMRRLIVPILITVAALSGGCGGGSAPDPAPEPAPPPGTLVGPAWRGFGGDAQHTALGAVATQPLSRVRWSAPMDLSPQHVGSDLLIHYGSPVITARNVVLMPVKTGALGGFRVEARSGTSGALRWSAVSDYILPEHDWTPSYNLTLTENNRLHMPGAGGKIFFVDDADALAVTLKASIFYGSETYLASQQIFDASVFINTPITADSAGNLFFGFLVTGENPAGLVSGIARIGADGVGRWVAASTAAADATIAKVAMNSAPALSNDQRTLYVAVNTAGVRGTRQSGYLLALDSSTLVTRAAQRLNDSRNGKPAWVSDNASSSATIGPDGDVYFGVLESDPPGHNFRGWLLHFDAGLTVNKLPGSFGWDISASVVPSSMVSGYSGASAYLVMTKYNNYAGSGSGDGRNRMAVLDPFQSQPDTISGNPVMREILTLLGPTPDAGYPGGVTEWCINTAAVDPLTNSILVNSEDGYLYRWSTVTNQIDERIRLTSGVGEAYTPTAIGPDGAVYAIQNATLFSVGR